MRAVLLLLVACGSRSTPAPAASGPPAAMIALHPPGDPIVATIDGTIPIVASCVAQQMARGAATQKAALDECYTFELLALEAKQRGLDLDPEVIDATRTAVVDRFVALEFDRRYRTPADLRKEIDAMLATDPPLQLVLEARVVSHALIKVDANDPPEVVEQRRRVAEEIYSELKDDTGLMFAHIKAVAEPIAKRAGVIEQLHVATEKPYYGRQLGQNWERPFVAALKAIPEVGRAAPVVRTVHGWHVMVLTELIPPRTGPELEAIAFENQRILKFLEWTDELARKNNNQISVNEKALEEPTP
jgi:hypothetical protein